MENLQNTNGVTKSLIHCPFGKNLMRTIVYTCAQCAMQSIIVSSPNLLNCTMDSATTTNTNTRCDKNMPVLREDPNGLTPPPFGHCTNSDWPPPPHSTGHSGALFFGPFFTILQGCMLPKTVSAPNHLGKRLDPPKNKDMPI